MPEVIEPEIIKIDYGKSENGIQASTDLVLQRAQEELGQNLKHALEEGLKNEDLDRQNNRLNMEDTTNFSMEVSTSIRFYDLLQSLLHQLHQRNFTVLFRFPKDKEGRKKLTMQIGGKLTMKDRAYLAQMNKIFADQDETGEAQVYVAQNSL